MSSKFTKIARSPTGTGSLGNGARALAAGPARRAGASCAAHSEGPRPSAGATDLLARDGSGGADSRWGDDDPAVVGAGGSHRSPGSAFVRRTHCEGQVGSLCRDRKCRLTPCWSFSRQRSPWARRPYPSKKLPLHQSHWWWVADLIESRYFDEAKAATMHASGAQPPLATGSTRLPTPRARGCIVRSVRAGRWPSPRRLDCACRTFRDAATRRTGAHAGSHHAFSDDWTRRKEPTQWVGCGVALGLIHLYSKKPAKLSAGFLLSFDLRGLATIWIWSSPGLWRNLPR
jgi:hypothetical protein